MISSLQHQKKTIMEMNTIIWKYFNARRGCIEPASKALWELMMYLYVQNGGNENRLLKIMEPYKYVAGILSVDEERALCADYSTAVEILSKPWNFEGFGEMSGWNQTVMEIIPALFELPAGLKIYNPFAGISSVAVALPQCHIVGNEAKDLSWAVGKIRLHAAGIESEIELCDFPMSDETGTHEAIVAVIPFYIHEQEEFDAILKRLYSQLADGGFMVLVIGSDYLRMRGMVGDLVNRREIFGIMSLPENLIAWNSRSGTEMMFIEKKPHGFIRMYDASGAINGNNDFDIDYIYEDVNCAAAYRDVSYDAIEYTGLLSPVCWDVEDDGSDSVYEGFIPLESYVDFAVADQNMDHFLDVTMGDLSVKMPGNPIGRSNRFGACISGPAVVVALEEVDYWQYRSRIGYLESESYVTIPQTMMAMLPKEGVSLEHMMVLAMEEAFSRQLHAICRKGQGYSIEDLNSILVPDYSEEVRMDLIHMRMRESMSAAEQQILQERERFEKMVRLRKHDLSQKMSSLSSNWNCLNRYAEKVDGIMKGDDLISSVRTMTVGKLVERIDLSIREICAKLEELITVRDLDADEINIAEFVRSYVSSNVHSDYNLVSSGQDQDVIITSMAKEELACIVDNIVSNAAYHGFKERKNQNNYIRINWTSRADFVELIISNNGTPIKEDMELEKLSLEGYSSDLHKDGHEGRGLSDIKEILMKVGGDFKIRSDREAEFTVSCHVYLPKRK